MPKPEKECDIIMKGGITSGIVYPKAILRLSQHYRFRSVGGTSAGAIAAAFTAAAEYNRDGGGFEAIARIPGEMREQLATLFQPSREVRTLFDIAKFGVLEKQWGRVALSIFAAHGQLLLAGVAIGVAAAVLALVLGGGMLGALLLVLIGAAIGLGLVAFALVRTITHDLPKLDFGLCPGPTQEGSGRPGLSDWLADTIEIAAGRMRPDGPRPSEPLTFGDLWRGAMDGKGTKEAPSINLRMMTTNLSLRRPNILPHLDKNHSFKEEDFRRVFPGWVVNYLMKVSTCGLHGCRMLPPAEKLPVVVATRMSLSFPFLLSAVRLYRKEFPAADERLVPMLFSDGGLSSNFPVHFFDALLPRRPTFGISLDDYSELYPKRSVRLPMSAGSGIWLDAQARPESVVSFVMALVNAAKDWQDRLQSTLPGYRERIVTVYLKPDQGGLNLSMKPEVVDALTELGDRAAALLVDQCSTEGDKEPFDFDDHRWRRFLVAFARIEETLQQAAEVWGDESDPESFASFTKARIESPASYGKTKPEWRGKIHARFGEIMALARAWGKPGLRDEDGGIPRPPTDMRITPKP